MNEPPLSCWLTQVGEVVVVGLAGRLDMATAPRLRAMLRKAEAEQPAAMVVDLSAVVVADQLPLLVLTAGQEHRQGSGYIPTVLCCADPRVVELLERSPLTRRLPVRASMAAAVQAAQETDPVPHRVIRAFEPTRKAPALAREFLAETCRAWQLERVLPTASVVVSELCTNVVVHVGSPMTVVLTQTDRSLHVVVRDSDPTRPVPARRGDLESTSGRGMHLIESLSKAWGVVSTTNGKAVWAVIGTRAG